MKNVYQTVTPQQSAVMPQWISSMGLEWLYKALLKLEVKVESLDKR